MLQKLIVNNVALIDKLEMDFTEGMNVLSGETGAGKSVIADALSFVLGERADRSIIKHGKDFCLVEAFFSLQENSKACQVLSELGLLSQNELIVSRVLNTSGRGEIRINGKLSTVMTLKSITSLIFDIFGQSEHQNFLKKEKHKETIDNYCGNSGLIREFRQVYTEIEGLNEQLKKFGGSQRERERKLELLSFQINEIEKAEISKEEENSLINTRKVMLNAEKILQGINNAEGFLDVDSGALGCVGQVISQLKGLSKYDDDFSEIENRIESLKFELIDIVDVLADKRSQCEFSQVELDLVEERLDIYKNLKRKYGDSVEDIKAFYLECQNEYDKLINATNIIEGINKEIEKAKKKLYEIAVNLSNIRRQKSKELCRLIEKELKDLGMKSSKFEVEFNQIPVYDSFMDKLNENGFDELEFIMSANAGEPLKPLVKVISGGEMSRFMLAVKNITAKLERIPTMLFDEIDTGISGNMAEVIAVKLHNISKDYQCIVITHLAQPMAVADSHFLIEKTEKDGKTFSSVRKITGDERVREIARILGGGLSKQANVLAVELLKWGEDIKQI